MLKDIYKFPRTRHLINLGSASRDDLILSKDEMKRFLDVSDGSIITLEEKVDGANLGISIDEVTLAFRVQNRSHYVNRNSHEQFKKLDKWLGDHSSDLFALLQPDESKLNPRTKYIVYGEWLCLKHSIGYDRLPDTFLVFDIFEAYSGKFLSQPVSFNNSKVFK